jgi:hypothetical protein
MVMASKNNLWDDVVVRYELIHFVINADMPWLEAKHTFFWVPMQEPVKVCLSRIDWTAKSSIGTSLLERLFP